MDREIFSYFYSPFSVEYCGITEVGDRERIPHRPTSSNANPQTPRAPEERTNSNMAKYVILKHEATRDNFLDLLKRWGLSNYFRLPIYLASKVGMDLLLKVITKSVKTAKNVNIHIVPIFLVEPGLDLKSELDDYLDPDIHYVGVHFSSPSWQNRDSIRFTHYVNAECSLDRMLSILFKQPRPHFSVLHIDNLGQTHDTSKVTYCSGKQEWGTYIFNFFD